MTDRLYWYRIIYYQKWLHCRAYFIKRRLIKMRFFCSRTVRGGFGQEMMGRMILEFPGVRKMKALDRAV